MTAERPSCATAAEITPLGADQELLGFEEVPGCGESDCFQQDFGYLASKEGLRASVLSWGGGTARRSR